MKDFIIKDTENVDVKRLIISDESNSDTKGIKADKSILKKIFMQIKSEFEEKK